MEDRWVGISFVVDLLRKQADDLEAPQHFCSLDPKLVLDSFVEDIGCKFDHDVGADSTVAFEHVLFDFHAEIDEPLDEIGFEGYCLLFGVGQLEGNATYFIDLFCFYVDGVIEVGCCDVDCATDHVFGCFRDEQDLVLVFVEGFHGDVLELQVVCAFFGREGQEGVELG
jgi:hypothetical protein